MPDVSIVIPAYNSGETIGRTLNSLRAQQHARWEAIVVDDGSSDKTADIVAEVARGDRRIHLIKQPNAGAGAARKTGLAHAQGEWIIFLDADDTLSAGHLSRMLRAVRDDPGANVGASLYHCGWRRRREGVLWWSPYPARPISDPFGATTRGCPFAIHSAMTRRETILAAGSFDPTFRICEDWDLWQRIARRGARFVPVSGLWADVHVRAGSLSGDTMRHLADGLAVIRRGHGADLRVSDPAPSLAAGAPAAACPDAVWSHALWIVGAAIGRGTEYRPQLEALRDEVPLALTDVYTIAAILEDALVVGAGLPGPPWPALWDQVGSDVLELIKWLDGSGDPLGLGARLAKQMDTRILSRLVPETTNRIDRLQRHTVDLAEVIPDLDLPGVQRLHCKVTLGLKSVGQFLLAPFGEINAKDLRGEILSRFDSPDLRRELLALRMKQQAPGCDSSLLAQTDETKVIDLLFQVPPRSDSNPSQQDRIAAIIADARLEADNMVTSRAARSDAVQARTGPAPDEVVDYKDEAYWEGIFSAKDPWDYRNPYEAVKYDQTIDLLDGRHFDDALEIACAEGEFTRRLAPLCERILATDIAPSAVERAAEKLRDLGNVTCRKLDLLTDELPGDFDLIVCSEVLYYLEDDAMLARFCGKVAEHLRPGGWFITAHAKLTVDEPDRTGFGWPHQFGATGIGNAFAATPGLTRDAEFETPLYRIQRFRKLAENEAEEPATPPMLDLRQGKVASPMPARIAEMVKWRGGKEIADAAEWRDFPVLMYHRIADDGPAGLAQWRTKPAAFEAQLAWLAENGWQGISFERMTWAVLWQTALPPKSVMLTFDDATQDFLDEALPLLHRYGFPATLFVPTDNVGGAADWDAAHGEPAAILGWDDITALRQQDITIASHGSAHVHLSMLDGQAIVRNLARSKAVLEAALAKDVRGVAYPFGDFDMPVADLARKVGFEFGFTCFDGFVSRASHRLMLPRREVKGGINLEAFAALVGADRT